MTLNIRTLARWAGYAGFLAIAVLSLIPGSARPHSGASGVSEHLLAYALVGAALACGHPGWRARLLTGLLLPAAAAVLEVLQLLIPGRTSELAGFVSSTTGAWLGIGIMAATLAIWRAARNGAMASWRPK